MLVYGDTNSTLAGALAAAQLRIPVAHVEAGMRSFDRAMPEELNRVLTDHLSELLLVPSQTAAENLAREGVAGEVELVGDVMVDVAALLAPRARADGGPLEAAGVQRRGVRARDRAPGRQRRRPGSASSCSSSCCCRSASPVVLPLHPRTRARLEATGLLDRLAAGAILLPPLGYLAFTSLLTRARAVLTDSGGVQKEAYLAGVRCVTLRDTTEWVETVQAGWNTLVDLDAGAARAALGYPLPAQRPELYGDGRAAERVVGAMTRLAAR